MVAVKTLVPEDVTFPARLSWMVEALPLLPKMIRPVSRFRPPAPMVAVVVWGAVALPTKRRAALLDRARLWVVKDWDELISWIPAVKAVAPVTV